VSPRGQRKSTTPVADAPRPGRPTPRGQRLRVRPVEPRAHGRVAGFRGDVHVERARAVQELRAELAQPHAVLVPRHLAGESAHVDAVEGALRAFQRS
jgi:hypothetical protein